MGLHFKLGFDLNETSDNKYYVNQRKMKFQKGLEILQKTWLVCFRFLYFCLAEKDHPRHLSDRI